MSNPNSSDPTSFTFDDLDQAAEIEKIDFLNRDPDPTLFTSDNPEEANEINNTFNLLNSDPDPTLITSDDQTQNEIKQAVNLSNNDQASVPDHSFFLPYFDLIPKDSQIAILLDYVKFNEQVTDHSQAQSTDNHNNLLLLTGVDSRKLSLNSAQDHIHPDLDLQILNEIAKYTNIDEKELNYEREEENQSDKKNRDKIKDVENKIIHSIKITDTFSDKYTSTTTAYIQNTNNILGESIPKKNENKRQAEKENSNDLLKNSAEKKRFRR